MVHTRLVVLGAVDGVSASNKASYLITHNRKSCIATTHSKVDHTYLDISTSESLYFVLIFSNFDFISTAASPDW